MLASIKTISRSLNPGIGVHLFTRLGRLVTKDVQNKESPPSALHISPVSCLRWIYRWTLGIG